MIFLKEYTLLEELGKGGFATVYKVRHNELGYIRAIRVLNDTVTDPSSAAYQKFLRECKVLLRLGNGNHHNIVHIYQPRFLENHALVEMDYVDGNDISKYLKANARFIPSDEVIRMVEQISSALSYCHEDIYKYCMDRDADNLVDDPNDGSKVLVDEATRQRLIKKYKVIHNDIHSGNIMRREDGTFVLLDFGLAITGNDDVRNSSRHDNGAVEFKAPEKWNNDTLLTEQSDIYSFGIVMYEYLAGRVPFPFDKNDKNRASAEFRLCKSHKTEVPPSIFELRKAYYEAKYPGKTYEKDYPDWLEEAIMRCLEKDPERRFKNGRELNDFISKNNTKKSRSFGDNFRKGNKNWKKSAAILGVLAGLILFALGFFVSRSLYRESPANDNVFQDKTFNVSVPFEMVAVKGGTFIMGATPEDGANDPNDKKKIAHEVTVGDYYIGKYEVTQGLWKAVMGTNPSKWVDDNLPVEQVSWNDCQEFIKRLNKITGKKFRLPTEAEWEYAARGGMESHGYKYSGSNDINDVAWYYRNSGNKTHAVGTKKPNELGIYDMTGNVWEWCQDYEGDYSNKPQTNPTGPSKGSSRVLRGGSWVNNADAGYCRVFDRNSLKPNSVNYYMGFRLVAEK